ncbi:hypothetical protein N665_2581s0005 [Sinapis alba]|nr:hypothetical protein N665_2581s0005 [Sinapis alba]
MLCVQILLVSVLGDAENDPGDAENDPADAGLGTPLPIDTSPDADKDTTLEGICFEYYRTGGEEEAEKESETEAEKEGETKANKEGETEAAKEGEEGEKEDDGDKPSTLQIMAEAAERVAKAAEEKDALEKAVADKEGEEGEKENDGDDDALEKVDSIGDSHDAGKMRKRVSRRSHLLRSPFTPN